MLPCPYLNVFFFFSPTGFLFLPGPPVRSCYRVAEGGMLTPPPALPGPGQEGFLKGSAAGPLLINGLQRWQERPWSWVLSLAPAAREFLSVIFQCSPRSPLCLSFLIHPTHILSPLSSSSLPCSSLFPPPHLSLWPIWVPSLNFLVSGGPDLHKWAACLLSSGSLCCLHPMEPSGHPYLSTSRKGTKADPCPYRPGDSGGFQTG